MERNSGPASTPVFEARNLCFSYEGRGRVLDGVSFRIGQGQSWALLGANGSGKSTLLRLLDGLQVPETGALHAFGEPLDRALLAHPERSARFRRRLGFVFQNSEAQLFSASVTEELAYAPQQLGLGEDEIANRVRDIAAMLGIGRLLDRPPYQLSGGEKKRIALGSVLTVNPEALLLDEPTAGLDPRSRVWLAEMLAKLNGAGKTLVTATHDLDLIRRFATHALVLSEEGAVAASGEIEAILEDRELLKRVNLVHDHGHWHGDLYHSHPHSHAGDHEHRHDEAD